MAGRSRGSGVWRGIAEKEEPHFRTEKHRGWKFKCKSKFKYTLARPVECQSFGIY
jgi:hypothetical protein